jgi:2,3-bisphosphoglycerate-dependent phosphoglycerate mutase
MVQEIYVLRHAAPDRTSTIPYNIPPGPALTAVGQREARQAAQWLRDRAIDIAYVSPFHRTRQTALIVSEQLRMPFSILEEIREGAPGEQHDMVRTRIRGVLATLDQVAPARVMLVTHGCCVLATLQLTTNDTIDLSQHRYDYGNQSPTAGIWHGVRRSDGLFDWQLAFKPELVNS